MSTTPDAPKPQHTDLDELREEIDELKSIPVEELVNPTPADLADREPTPTPTDSIGSEDWGTSQ
jgi:hypothetical protein